MHKRKHLIIYLFRLVCFCLCSASCLLVMLQRLSSHFQFGLSVCVRVPSISKLSPIDTKQELRKWNSTRHVKCCHVTHSLRSTDGAISCSRCCEDRSQVKHKIIANHLYGPIVWVHLTQSHAAQGSDGAKRSLLNCCFSLGNDKIGLPFLRLMLMMMMWCSHIVCTTNSIYIQSTLVYGGGWRK